MREIILLNGNIKIERWEHSQFSIHQLFALCISKNKQKSNYKKKINFWRKVKNQDESACFSSFERKNFQEKEKIFFWKNKLKNKWIKNKSEFIEKILKCKN